MKRKFNLLELSTVACASFFCVGCGPQHLTDRHRVQMAADSLTLSNTAFKIARNRGKVSYEVEQSYDAALYIAEDALQTSWIDVKPDGKLDDPYALVTLEDAMAGILTIRESIESVD